MVGTDKGLGAVVLGSVIKSVEEYWFQIICFFSRSSFAKKNILDNTKYIFICIL